MKRAEKGFTLIELLVVIAIIGILAAIAIPQFASYRARGFDARARSDLRNGATAEENYFAQFEEYVDLAECSGDDDLTCGGVLPGFRKSLGTTISFTDAGASFTGISSHPNGTDGLTCTWDSAQGGDQGCEVGAP